MRIRVDVNKICVHSESEPEQYGSWSEQWDCNVSDVYQITEDENVTHDSETFLIPDDATEVYVVYMIYSTGDSFGNADGLIDVLHATVSSEAANLLATKVTENSDKWTIEFTDDFGREISINNSGAGYFENIESVNVERFSVGGAAKKRRYFVN